MFSKKILTITIIALSVVIIIFYLSQKKEKGLQPTSFFSPTSTLQESEEKNIELKISFGKIEPNTFSVQGGERIRLSLTSLEGKHLIKFEDEKLAKIEGSFREGETFVITFTAPHEIGEYKFFCEELDHRRNGEEGTMIVK